MKHRWSLIVLLLFLACGGSTILTTEGLDKSCTTKDDCISVLVGDTCKCDCNYDAINKKDESKFRNQGNQPRSCDLACGACQQTELSCNKGVCTATPKPE